MGEMALLLVAAAILGGPTYTAPQVQRSFRAQTGVRLVNLASVTNADLTAFETKPRVTARFGQFELYVVRPAKVRSFARALLGKTRPDAHGIYWEPDQNTGVTAITRYGSNVFANWFPPGGHHRLNATWRRLDTVLRRLR
jgi:hypothetical protein